MTIREMTLEQLRNWHAKRIGAYFSMDLDMGPIGWCDKDGNLIDDPFPPTLDGAASAMPEGWTWERRDGSYWARPIQQRRTPTLRARVEWTVRIDDTCVEITDRYRLAAMAREQKGTTNDKV